MMSLLKPVNSCGRVQKQPQAIHKQMNLAVLQ